MKRIKMGVAAAIVATLAFGNAAQAATPTATPMFSTTTTGNQQGLATDGHKVWVSYDVGGGKARIKTYTWKGVYIGQSVALPLGHAAEIDYRVADNSLYVANGGLETQAVGADTQVYRVTMNSAGIAQKVVKTYDFKWLGHNGLVAVNNSNDTLVAMGGPDAGPWTLTTHTFGHASRASALSTVTITDPGVLLQGLAVVNGVTWLYVSEGGVNRVDKFSACGELLTQTVLPFKGEAEGIAVNPLTGSIYVGAHSGNRVIRIGGV